MKNKYIIKRLIFVFVLTFIASFAKAQVGINTPPNPFSILDIAAKNGTSGVGGLRLPMVSSLSAVDFKIGALKTQAAGLMVYNKADSTVYTWNGSAWKELIPGISDKLESSTGSLGILDINSPRGSFLSNDSIDLKDGAITPTKFAGGNTPNSILTLNSSGVPTFIAKNNFQVTTPYNGIKVKNDTLVLGGSLISNLNIKSTADSILFTGKGVFNVNNNLIVDANNGYVGIDTFPRTDLDLKGTISTSKYNLDVSSISNGQIAIVPDGYGKVALVGNPTDSFNISIDNGVDGQQLIVSNETSHIAYLGQEEILSNRVQKFVYSNSVWKPLTLSLDAANIQSWRINIPITGYPGATTYCHDWSDPSDPNYNRDKDQASGVPTYTETKDWFLYTKKSKGSTATTNPVQIYLVYQYRGPALDLTNIFPITTMIANNHISLQLQFVKIENINTPVYNLDLSQGESSGATPIMPNLNNGVKRTQITLIFTRVDGVSAWGKQTWANLLLINKAVQ